ncbi:MAG: PIN domain-containing protein [Thermoproteota archaeon]
MIARPTILRGIFWKRPFRGELEVYLTYTTILETYNVLFWYYRVRPLRKLLEKLKLTVSALKVVESSINGLEISSAENILLGDGFLIATALAHRIPIIVSNDQDIANKASKYGLIVENPIPEEIRKKLMKYEAQR